MHVHEINLIQSRRKNGVIFTPHVQLSPIAFCFDSRFFFLRYRGSFFSALLEFLSRSFFLFLVVFSLDHSYFLFPVVALILL
jgi:hypothetical protein